MTNTLKKINIPASTLSELPNINNKTHEAQYINELTFKRTRTNSGNVSWTSETSGITYNTSDYQSNINVYNSGETGLLNLLQMECAEFLMDATDFTSLGEHYNVLQNLTITGGRYYKIAQIDISTDTSYYNQLSLLIGGTGINTTSFRGYYFVDFSSDITGTDLNVTQFYTNKYLFVYPFIPQDEIFFGYNVNDSTNQVELWVYLAQNMESFGITVINNYEKSHTNVFEVGDLTQTITSPSNFVRVNAQHLMKNTDVCNPNLFINGNFQDPINQQGLMTYSNTTSTTSILTIDRWELEDSSTTTFSTFTVIPRGSGNGLCKITVPANDTATLYQKIEAKNFIVGMYYTVSFNMSGLSQVNSLTVTTSSDGTTETTIPITTKKEYHGNDIGVVYGTFLANSAAVSITVGINLTSTNTETEFRFLSAKLELGEIPTRFFAPDYGQELLKCQRFLYIIENPNTSQSLVIGDGYTGGDSNSKFINIPLSTSMYSKPTVISGIENLIIRGIGYNTNYKVTSIINSNTSSLNNMITLQIASDHSAANSMTRLLLAPSTSSTKSRIYISAII